MVRRSDRIGIVAAWVFVSAGAHAQSAAAPAADEIVVTAAPPAQQVLIDRKIYLVKNNAEAQTENALDVLRHVPSVTVSAKDQVQLLGDSGVKVLVDGHPAGTAANVLKTLPAAQIARIEVMTNPSAAYTADATGGIINIITRHDAAAGLAGAATAALGSFGSTEMKLAPSYAGDRWSTSLTLDLRHDISDYRATRERTARDPALALDQVQHGNENIDYFSGRFDLSYRPRPSATWTLNLQANDIVAHLASRRDSLSRGSALIPLSEDNDATQHYRHNVATLGYNWTGKRQGESLNISGNYDDLRYDWPGIILDRFDGDTRRSDIVRGGVTGTGELKLDYVHPLRNADTLSLGAALTHVRDGLTNGFLVSNPSSSVPASPPVRLVGTWTTAAAYATFQFPLGTWKILPGLRAEERIRHVGALGSTARDEALLLFPSVHVDHKLARRLELAASYSRRIEWPTIMQLDPTIRYEDLLAGDAGNPGLRPQMTDTVETSLAFTPGKQSLTLKLYDRETSDSFARAATIQPDGVSITSPVNGGHSSKRGGELAASGPIWQGWRYSASTNIGLRRTEIVADGRFRTFDQFGYSGNMQLEYQSKADGKPGADHVVLETQYSGPTRIYQQHVASWAETTLRWTHSYTPRFSSIVRVSDLFASDRNDTILYGTDYTQIDRSREASRRIMVSLVSRLGRVK